MTHRRENSNVVGQASSEDVSTSELQARLAAIVDSAHDAIIGKTLEGTITSWNPAAERIFGYSAEEMVGQKISRLIPPERGYEEERIIAEIRQGKPVEHYETVRVRKDGRRIDISVTVSPVRDSDGRIAGASKVARDISERKLAEKQLEMSLKEVVDLKAALDEHAIVAITDPRGRITYVNDKFCAISKYSREELLGQDHRIINSGHHPKEFIRDLWTTIAHGRVWKGEIKNRAKDGSIYWVDTTIVPFLDADGKPYQYVAIRADITERKRTREQALWLASFPQQNPNPILEFDSGTEIVSYANPSVIEQMPEIMSLGVRHPLLAGLQEAERDLREGKVEVIRRERAVGELFFAQTITYLSEVGRLRIYSSDITERKRAEDRIKSSLREIGDLKTALDEHAIVAITDPRGRITYVNDKFCAISKYSREELLGQDHRIINSGHHPKEFIRDLWTTIAHGKVWKGEIKNKARDGTFYWVDTTIVPFLDADGKPYQYVAIRADVTQRKRVEEEIQTLNRELTRRVRERTADLMAANEELEAFSYSVSHDLRAPLRHIDGFAGLLRECAASVLPPDGRRYLDQIADCAKKMSRLIDDLLQFSRTGRAEIRRSRVDTNALVAEIIRELTADAEGRDIQWKVEILPKVLADSAMLRQVFVNLLANAVKYSRPRERAEIEIGCGPDTADEVVLFVRDNGVGFDMEYADKLFGVFQRLHSDAEFEGTGIGLANVRRIIARHGGRTWAEGRPDAGATFYFSLPRVYEM